MHGSAVVLLVIACSCRESTSRPASSVMQWQACGVARNESGMVYSLVVYTMTAFREHCLSLPHGSHIAITNVQQIVEEDVELTRIQ
jgi:hypothetical protein